MADCNNTLSSIICVVFIIFCGFGCNSKKVRFLVPNSQPHCEDSSLVEISDQCENQEECLLKAEASVLSGGDSFDNSSRGVVVLLHGLMGDRQELEEIQNRLSNHSDFQDILVIMPECRAGNASLVNGMNWQTERVFEEICREMKSRDLDVKSTPVVLFGFSQGGLVGLNLAKKYGGQFNLKAVVTMNTPIAGVPLLEVTLPTVQRRFNNMKPGLEIVRQRVAEIPGYPISCASKKTFLRKICDSMFSTTLLISGCKRVVPGIRDMRCDSSFIGKTRESLKNKSDDVPYLFIASYTDNFDQLFEVSGNDLGANDSTSIAALNGTYNTLVTNSESGKHDTLIPLYSQLGHRASSFENISQSIDTEMPKVDEVKTVRSMSLSSGAYKNVTYKVYDGTVHAGNIVAMHRNLFITNPDVESTNCSDTVIEYLLKFIHEQIYR